MQRTRFGSLLLAVGWTCFLVALVVQSLAPAFLGTLLVALVVTRPRPVADVRVTRELPERAAAGAPAEITTRATDTGGAPLFVDDPPPSGVNVASREHRAERGRATLVQRVTSPDAGARVWTTARVRYQDDWGILEDAAVVPAISYLDFAPAKGGVPGSVRAARRQALTVRSKRSMGTEWEAEVERLREYQAGDRLRDIDWGHSTKLGHLVTREIAQTGTMPLVVLMDARESLRRHRRASKLATLTRAALAVVSAGQSAGIATGFVAWSERGVEAQVRATVNRPALVNAALGVGVLPTLPWTPPTPDADRAGATSVAPVFTGITRVASQPSVVVALVDAEEDPDFALGLVHRLVQKGHRVVVAAPATGAHHYALPDVDPDVIPHLAAWRRNRETVAQACQARGVPFIPVGPHVTDDTFEEVMRSAV